jgi:hypothetical protein
MKHLALSLGILSLLTAPMAAQAFGFDLPHLSFPGAPVAPVTQGCASPIGLNPALCR